MRAILAALLLFSLNSQAAIVSRVSDFEAGEKIIADDLNDEFDNIISTLNGNLSSANLGNSAVATANIATAAVTKLKLAPLGQQISNASDFTTTSLADVFVDNLSITLTTNGRPVMVGLIPDSASATAAYIGARDAISLQPRASFTIRRNATTDIAYFRVTGGLFSTFGEMYIPPGAVYTIDVPTASSHTYRLMTKSLATGSAATMRSVRIFGFEL